MTAAILAAADCADGEPMTWWQALVTTAGIVAMVLALAFLLFWRRR